MRCCLYVCVSVSAVLCQGLAMARGSGGTTEVTLQGEVEALIDRQAPLLATRAGRRRRRRHRHLGSRRWAAT